MNLGLWASQCLTKPNLTKEKSIMLILQKVRYKKFKKFKIPTILQLSDSLRISSLFTTDFVFKVLSVYFCSALHYHFSSQYQFLYKFYSDTVYWMGEIKKKFGMTLLYNLSFSCHFEVLLIFWFYVAIS